MLPEGLDIFDDPALVAQAAKQLGATGGGGKTHIDLQTIGEDAEFIAAQQKLGLIPPIVGSLPPLSAMAMGGVQTPADGVRNAVIAAKRRLTTPSAEALRDALAGKAEAKTPAVNAILRRMAERYGHDPTVLEDMVKDLTIV